MKYLVAVSGGVDSVVLLDMLVREDKHELVVAHFDHGIRPDSAADERFVYGLAEHYSLPFVAKREELGGGASEELARSRRYTFLRTEARKHNAIIVTAHHADDVIETIAINLTRGTGWRGLAVLETRDIIRPLLNMTKKEIKEYALAKKLEWAEDSTNAETQYLRNRIRRRLALRLSDEQSKRILEVWHQQAALKLQIDSEVARFTHNDNSEYARYFFINTEQTVACELLRGLVASKTKQSPTRPQLERALLAIKTARSRSFYEVGSGVRLRFTARSFFVETP